MLHAAEAGFAQQRGKACRCPLVGVFGVDALASRKAALTARPAHGGGGARSQVHLDPRLGGVEQRQVAPAADLEIAAQQPVQVFQTQQR